MINIYNILDPCRSWIFTQRSSLTLYDPKMRFWTDRASARRAMRSKRKTKWNLWVGRRFSLIVCVKVRSCLWWTVPDVSQWVMSTWKGSVSWNQRPTVVSTFPSEALLHAGHWFWPVPFLLFPPFLRPRGWQIDKTQTGEEAILYWVRLAVALHRSHPEARAVPFETSICAAAGRESTPTRLHTLAFAGAMGFMV